LNSHARVFALPNLPEGTDRGGPPTALPH
jgi:hypothetical protein